MTRADYSTDFETMPESTSDTESDVRRCWGCRKLWPRTAMRWGAVTEGPLWYPRTIRVLRCPDCLE